MSTKKFYREVVTYNAARCLVCGEIIESKSQHDFRSCPCRRLSVDGGIGPSACVRRCFTEMNEWVDLSLSYLEEREPYDWEIKND
jgi:hypothetical protein